MGAVLSQAASGAGTFLGNLVTAPLKSLFGGSCEGICSGPWDVGCFIEHLCISNLFKFVLILALCYIIVVFVYLLFKVGIFQCVIKSICKMCWTACATYCYALHHLTCCLCNRLTHVRRHRRRRRGHSHDIEIGGRGYDASDHHTASSSSSTSSSTGGRPHRRHSNGVCSGSSRKRKSSRTRDVGKRRFHGGRHGHRGVKMRGPKDVSIRMDGGVTRLRTPRRRRTRHIKGKKKKSGGGGGGYGSFKRRRLE